MTSKWTPIVRLHSPIKEDRIIVRYEIMRKSPRDDEDREIIFNSDETITIEEVIPEFKDLDDKVKAYAEEKKLTYQSTFFVKEKTTTLKPFHTKHLLLRDGSRKVWSTTDIFVERLKAKFTEERLTSIDHLKKITKMEIKNYKELTDLKFWGYHWIVKFAFIPKLIVNNETNELKLVVECQQLAFEHKEIQRKFKEIKMKDLSDFELRRWEAGTED